ncbi:MAG: hypothetical protein ACRDTD_29730 [Pseudonocardiaceae bacterium]
MVGLVLDVVEEVGDVVQFGVGVVASADSALVIVGVENDVRDRGRRRLLRSRVDSVTGRWVCGCPAVTERFDVPTTDPASVERRLRTRLADGM